MRILAFVVLVLSLVALPTPVAANHDPSDEYQEIINLGDDRVWYIDDSSPPMIYREDNRIAGLQRGSDNSGHLGHQNPDERIF